MLDDGKRKKPSHSDPFDTPYDQRRLWVIKTAAFFSRCRIGGLWRKSHKGDYSHTNFWPRWKCLSLHSGSLTGKRCSGSLCCWSGTFYPDSGWYWDISRAATDHKGRCGDLPELWSVLYLLLHGSLSWAYIQPGAALQCSLGWGIWIRHQHRGQYDLTPTEQAGAWPKASHLHQDRLSGGI